VERSRLYVAELVSALEYLHDTHSIFDWLQPRNVFLHSFGHILLTYTVLLEAMSNGASPLYRQEDRERDAE
jgi:hypothetical protein